jgi:HlyD family secretion protein
VSFPEVPTSYHDTIWYVEIPNTKSPSYAAAYNAYQDALRERSRAIDEAEAEVRAQTSGASIADAELAQAEAEVARIQALIGQRVLTAPFNGTVASIDVDPGESVNANDSAVSVISNDGFGVEIDLPEVDSVKVRVGNPVSIMLDALGEEVFTGSVVSVSRSETLVDGVSVYEARIAFDKTDDRISSGMTADVSIETSKRSGVLSVPARAIKYREDGTPYVLLRKAEGDKGEEKEIVLGLRGSDGSMEVTAGLSEGNTVIIAE